VVIINEAMAKQFFKDSDPLNERLVIGKGVMREFSTEGERQIIGVVGDTRDGGLQQTPGPAMYVPQSQVPDAANVLNLGLGPIAWVVRTAAEPYSMSASIQEQLRQATGLPVSDVRSMADVVMRSTSRQRFNMWLMSIFGASAVLLAAIGIYGLMAYTVEQRTQEIGIRLSLGADGASVRRMVVLQGMRLALAGVAIGLAASWGLARLMTSFLFDVTARGPLVFAGVPALLALVALAAVWLPARRASKVDPTVALRYE
jgi:putative ABC transport system permease protein